MHVSQTDGKGRWAAWLLAFLLAFFLCWGFCRLQERSGAAIVKVWTDLEEGLVRDVCRKVHEAFGFSSRDWFRLMF